MGQRVMAKVFEVEVAEKGSPLQTKINAFTKGKNITAVHDLTVTRADGKIKAVLLYDADEEASGTPRLLSKVVDNVPVDSTLQTKVNSFTKDKGLDVQAASTSVDGDSATVALLFVRTDGGAEDEASDASEAPAETPAEEPVAA